MKPRIAAIPGIIFICLVSFNAQAIVNVDSLHIGSSKDGLNGSLSATASGSSGNTDNSRVKLAMNTQWKHDNRIEILTASHLRGHSLGKVDVDTSFLHTRHIEGINKIIAAEAFAQIEANRFARLNFRGLAGLGLRFTVGELTQKQGVYFGLGGFLAQEDIAEESNTTDAGQNRFVRGNIYLVVQRKISDNVELYTTTYIQPSLSKANDLRLLEDLTIKLKVTDKLGIKLSLDISHDSDPPETVEQTDIQYATGLEFKY